MEKDGFATSGSAWLLWRLAPTLTVVHSASPAWRGTSSFEWLNKFMLTSQYAKKISGGCTCCKRNASTFSFVCSKYIQILLLIGKQCGEKMSPFCRAEWRETQGNARALSIWDETFKSSQKISKTLHQVLKSSSNWSTFDGGLYGHLRDFEPQLAKVSAVYYTLISKLVLRPLKEKTIASKGMRQPLANADVRWRTFQEEGRGFGIDNFWT